MDTRHPLFTTPDEEAARDVTRDALLPVWESRMSLLAETEDSDRFSLLLGELDTLAEFSSMLPRSVL